MKTFFTFILALGICCATLSPIYGQDQQPTQQPTTEAAEKEKAEREKNAYRLLDQVVDEAQSLRLTENRVRVQITAADLLWDSNQVRARSLFALAAEGMAELGRNSQNNNNRRGGPPNRSFQLRQELVLAAARHDAQLAYQLLASTKPAQPVIQPTLDSRSSRIQVTPEDNLEQLLLGRVAALDPRLAAQNAEQMMDKGMFPRSLTEVISQLQRQDAEAAAKLADKAVKKLQSTNLLSNNEAANLAQVLLALGPRLTDANPKETGGGRVAVLEQSAYTELLGIVVDLALKATPRTANNPRPQPQRRQLGTGGGVGPGQQNTGQQQLTDAMIEQNGARRLLAGLQIALPLMDQYLPAKAALVRQKLAEVGFSGAPVNMAQAFGALQGNPNSDALVQAAAVAPPQMQSRIYQQAAFKALEEGNTDRARQIATEHLQANARDAVMQRIDFREMTQKAEGARLDQIRQTIARLPSEEEKINFMLQIARDIQGTNPKLATQLLDEAKQMTSRRATGYDQFEQQLKVARAFATLDPARSFEVLDPAISQLNELLAAAAVLNGFEVNMFRDGELSMQGPNGLTSIVNRFGQELAQLARTDFERAETLAGRFQIAEARIMTRLAIVQGLLGPTKTART
jgi:hypothetical protein